MALKRFRNGIISLDLEMDGTNPLTHSIRSIGLAIFCEAGKIQSTLYMNLTPQENMMQVHAETKTQFWDVHPEQWHQVNQNVVSPTNAMHTISDWLKRLDVLFHKLTWLAKPSCVDWMFLKSYYEKYGPMDKFPIGYFCHCLETELSIYFKQNYIPDRKKFITNLENHAPVTHHALDDAIRQGCMYFNLRQLYIERRLKDQELDDVSLRIE